jgi:Arc/MetJ-type ribon-helix-helix transcriptional regulator
MNMKISDKTKTEIVNIRIDVETKRKLTELAKSNEYKNNSSAVIRHLIQSTYSKKVL